MITNLNNFLNESLDYETQSKYYWEQVNNPKGYKPITDELYDGIEEEGWVQDLTDDMTDDEYDANREIIKSGFVYKQLDLYYVWQKEHIINEYDYTLKIFNKFDLEIKISQTAPYHTLDFIDYDKGAVYIIKYKKSEALK